MNAIRVAQGCTRCPALTANRRRIVHGYGLSPLTVGSHPGVRVLFVGEAPGYKGGDLTGVPFTRDRSGVRLQQVLIELGLSEERDSRVEQPRLRCFVTNVVRCNPPGNRTPTRAEVANCLPYLWQEIDLLNAEIIVPMGNVAAQALFPRLVGRPAPPIGQTHARVFAGNGVTVVPMRHPARATRADLMRFVATMRALLPFSRQETSEL